MRGFETDPTRWIRLAEVDSTNSYAMREHLPSGSVVIADLQTKGRGRMGRSWQSEPGSLIFTGVISFNASEIADERLPLFAILAGTAVLRALETASPGTYRIKEPNDIILLSPEPGKVAGILVESEIAGERRVFVGIGVNLISAPPPLDSVYPPKAVYENRTAPQNARDELASLVIQEFNARLGQLTEPAHPAFAGEAESFYLSL